MNRNARAIAVEAARLMTSQAEADLASACRKAAKRLGIGNRRLWPDRALLEQVLREQQALFVGTRQHAALLQLRQAALELMGLLEPFQPALTGSLLSGLADAHSVIELHLFCERCEDLLLYLEDRGLRPRPDQRVFHYPDGRQQLRPQFLLDSGEYLAELSCFPLSERRSRPPRQPLSQEPMQRLGLQAARAAFSD